MNGDRTKLSVDSEYLRELEFGDKSEAIVRLVAVSVAGVLIYFYTGWVSALVWAIYFILAWSLHTYFVFRRQNLWSKLEVAVATLLFGNLQIAFGWLPVILFSNEQRQLMLVGGALICAQLLFLVRRNDQLKYYQTAQVTIVVFGSAIIYVAFLPILDTPLAAIGAALALIGLNYYFVQSLLVTRRMRLNHLESERQAHQAMKMAAIGQLAGGVAHDFNNNLTAIGGSLELAKLTQDAEERDVVLDNALVAVKQANRTVEKLLIFARSESPEVSELQVADVFSELERLTERLIPASTRFEVVEPEQSLAIYANQNQLLSGLVNLVSNSIDAMPKGGVLTLSSEKLRLAKPLPVAGGSYLECGDYVRITLQDSGDGIPDSIIMNVTNPFFTTKPIGKGTGLGLSMVYGMMKEMKGGMSIKSGHEGTAISLFFAVPVSGSATPWTHHLGPKSRQGLR